MNKEKILSNLKNKNIIILLIVIIIVLFTGGWIYKKINKD